MEIAAAASMPESFNTRAIGMATPMPRNPA